MANKNRSELYQFLALSRNAFLNTGAFSFVINLLMLTYPLFMLQVYDRVLTSRSETTLVMLMVLAVALLGVMGLLEALRSRVLVRVAGKLGEGLTGRVFNAVFQRAIQKPGGNPTLALRDLDTLRQFLSGQGLLTFFDAPWAPIFILVIFLIHPLLGIIALVGSLVVFGLALANEYLTRQPLQEANKEQNEAQNFADMSLRNAEVLHAMGMLPSVQQRWGDKRAEVLGLQAQASDRGGVIKATSKSLRMILQVLILGTGAYLAIYQIITPGMMIAASIIMGRAIAPVEQAVGTWTQFVSARSSYQRLRELLEEIPPSEPGMRLPRPEGNLSLDQVVVVPPGGQEPALRGISFDLAAGEQLGVVGPSAAGKSTLARVLVGVWPARGGHVRLDGMDVFQWDSEDMGPHVGYLPQDVELFDGTVAENIARFNEVDSDAVVAAAQKADAHEMILHLPEGYDSQIGAGGSVLSAGQRQRLGLARALYGDPAFVVLDEPNANLDQAGEEALREALERLKVEGVTTVVISHRPNILPVTQRTLVLRDGNQAALGPTQEILQKLAGGSGQGAAAAPAQQIENE